MKNAIFHCPCEKESSDLVPAHKGEIKGSVSLLVVFSQFVWAQSKVRHNWSLAFHLLARPMSSLECLRLDAPEERMSSSMPAKKSLEFVVRLLELYTIDVPKV
jgi:hypothetical protein